MSNQGLEQVLNRIQLAPDGDFPAPFESPATVDAKLEDSVRAFGEEEAVIVGLEVEDGTET